jgi:hypothetical protein
MNLMRIVLCVLSTGITGCASTSSTSSTSSTPATSTDAAAAKDRAACLKMCELAGTVERTPDEVSRCQDKCPAE